MTNSKWQSEVTSDVGGSLFFSNAHRKRNKFSSKRNLETLLLSETRSHCEVIMVFSKLNFCFFLQSFFLKVISSVVAFRLYIIHRGSCDHNLQIVNVILDWLPIFLKRRMLFEFKKSFEGLTKQNCPEPSYTTNLKDLDLGPHSCQFYYTCLSSLQKFIIRYRCIIILHRFHSSLNKQWTSWEKQPPAEIVEQVDCARGFGEKSIEFHYDRAHENLMYHTMFRVTHWLAFQWCSNSRTWSRRTKSYQTRLRDTSSPSSFSLVSSRKNGTTKYIGIDLFLMTKSRRFS